MKKGAIQPPFHYGIVLNILGSVKYDPGTLFFFLNKLPTGSNLTIAVIGGKGQLDSIMKRQPLNGLLFPYVGLFH